MPDEARSLIRHHQTSAVRRDCQGIWLEKTRRIPRAILHARDAIPREQHERRVRTPALRRCDHEDSVRARVGDVDVVVGVYGHSDW